LGLTAFEWNPIFFNNSTQFSAPRDEIQKPTWTDAADALNVVQSDVHGSLLRLGRDFRRFGLFVVDLDLLDLEGVRAVLRKGRNNRVEGVQGSGVVEGR
jgi:hypothetical protein